MDLTEFFLKCGSIAGGGFVEQIVPQDRGQVHSLTHDIKVMRHAAISAEVRSQFDHHFNAVLFRGIGQAGEVADVIHFTVVGGKAVDAGGGEYCDLCIGVFLRQYLVRPRRYPAPDEHFVAGSAAVGSLKFLRSGGVRSRSAAGRCQ